MFSFFEKKVFLVDYLHGLVDMHNHVLPGIDDGAKTVDQSLDLIKGFSEFGVTSFVFTPHVMHHYYPNTQETVKKAFILLQNELKLQGVLSVKTSYAAEHMIDDNFESLLASDEVLPIKKEYLLIEMSYLQPSLNFDGAIQKIASKGYYSILAHPERYAYYHNTLKVYETLKSKGILFQLNLLSLSGYYGTEIQKVAMYLLKEGMIDFVSSDAHHKNHIAQLKEIKIQKSTLNLLLPIIEKTILSFY
nr:CpsB/CapC family capsule biosynthesis tyrosine phosphatase [Allomuricauda sp.]